MKNILRQISILVLFILFWYSLAISVSYIFFPDRNNIDSNKSDKTVFYDQYSNIVLDMPRVAMSAKKEMFLIGSSNIREGFQPAEMAPLFPGYRIHNFGSGGSNVTQSREQVELIMRLFPKAAIKDTVFVLGFWYGELVDDEKRWKGGPTNMDKAATGTSLYKAANWRIYPTVNPKAMPYLIAFLRPRFALACRNSIFKDAVENTRTFVHNLIRERKVDFSVYVPKNAKITIDDAYRKYAIEFWRDYMGAKDGLLKEEQFKEFLSLCDFAAGSGAKVVIVDLPLPKWHSERSTYYADYQRKKVFYINEALKLPNIKYINMQGTMKDSDFRDSAHPGPAATKKWSELLKKGFAKSG